MKTKKVLFSYFLNGKEIKDSKFFSGSTNKVQIETIIFDHLNSIFPNSISNFNVKKISEE